MYTTLKHWGGEEYHPSVHVYNKIHLSICAEVCRLVVRCNRQMGVVNETML